MFGFGIFDYLKIGAGLIVGATLVFYPARWIGQGEGKQMAATAALTKSVTLLRERNVVNDQVSTSDAASLCADFGLSDADAAECVRRMAETNTQPGNVGNDPSNGSAVCKPGRGPQ
ncbi:hypothetical protein FBZ99_101817 [Rhizobium sp. ERR 1071]|uniref:hypothetical protein n=1 Tax=Rhizobium sp. ERR 1071 TaxID=2572677 RepID=UPI00119B438B|nr:hypothetical protein [Rhizobium sp. ERR1071]TWB20026.1 hypothetical protein FBZ99_101817 [Rhizobium sp. ERR1071]